MHKWWVIMENFAGTVEHLKYLQQFEYIFSDLYFIKDLSEKIDEKYSLTIKEYNHTYEASNKFGYSISCQEYYLYNEKNELLFNTKFCFGRSFFKYLKHVNRNDYFICGNDLCDFTIFNITANIEHRFISGDLLFENYKPGCSNGFWYVTTLLYYPNGNFLVVNGQDTMNREMCVVCDFSNPDQVPYKNKSLSVFCDDSCTAIKFTETGLLIGIGEDNYVEKEIPYNILHELLIAQ